jgi:hypothetical protein
MCSCDYFVPINYRCVAAEKDDCSWSITLSLREIVLENSTSSRTRCEQNSVEVDVKSFLDGRDRHVPRKEIFDLSRASVTLGMGRMLIQHHFFLDFTFYRLYTSMSCNKRPLHFKSMKNGKGE